MGLKIAAPWSYRKAPALVGPHSVSSRASGEPESPTPNDKYTAKGVLPRQGPREGASGPLSIGFHEPSCFTTAKDLVCGVECLLHTAETLQGAGRRRRKALASVRLFVLVTCSDDKERKGQRFTTTAQHSGSILLMPEQVTYSQVQKKKGIMLNFNLNESATRTLAPLGLDWLEGRVKESPEN